MGSEMCIRDRPRLWRDKDGRRVPREDVKETLIELDQRGYLLGIICLLYTSDAADDLLCVDLGGRRIIKKKKTTYK